MIKSHVFLFLSLDYMMDEESFTILDYGCPLQTLVITIYDVKGEGFESGLLYEGEKP